MGGKYYGKNDTIEEKYYKPVENRNIIDVRYWDIAHYPIVF